MEREESHQDTKRAQQGEAKSHQAMAVKESLLASTLTASKCIDRPHYKVVTPNESISLSDTKWPDL